MGVRLTSRWWRMAMSESMKGILMFAGLAVVTVTITVLTIWSFNKRKPDDQDEDPDLFI